MRLKYYSKARVLCTYPKKTLQIVKSLKERLQSAQCLSDGKVLQVSLLPLMLNTREIKLIQYTCEILSSVIEKTLSALSSPKIKEYINYESIPHNWLEVFPGYKRQVAIARLDAAFDGKNLKYIEFHTDNPGAQAWNYAIRQVFLDHPFYRSLARFIKEESEPLVLCEMKKTIESLYREFPHKPSEKLSVAFVDYEDSASSTDTLLCTQYLTKQGIDAFIADPRHFVFRDGMATYKGKKVEFVRRAMKAQEFMREQAKNENFIKGYLERSFCMMNSFRAIYGSEKSLFALITNPQFHHLYTKEEVKVIKKYIPWTRMLSEEETTSETGEKISLENYIRNNRERLVMKTTRIYLGKDVFIGIETDPKEWEKTFLSQKGNKDWIVQEYVPMKSIPMPSLSENTVKVQKKYFSLGTFVVNGRFSGILGRFADIPQIHLSKSSGFLPVFRY